MTISDIKIRAVLHGEQKLKAVASVTIDNCFAVHDIKIIEGADGMFVSMPSRQTKEGRYKDIAHPINSETRKQLTEAVLDAYRRESLI